MKNKKTIKIVIIVLSIILVLTALFTASYALFTNETIATDENSYTTGLLAITANSKTDRISLTSALPITDEAGIETEPYIFTIKNVGNLDYRFDLKLLSTGDASTNTVISPAFIKLQVDDGDVTTLASSSGIIKEDITLRAGESLEVKLRVWLSIDATNDQIGRTFTSQIVANGEAIYTETNSNINLAAHIVNLYKPNKTAENNSIVYNLDTNNQLMKDVAGNIRYYGADTTYDTDETTITNELKNYIYFNCDTYPDTNCELWRIIGVFEDKVKLIKDEPLGQFPFDTPTYSVNWNDSDIKAILNTAYLNNENTSYYQYDEDTTNMIPVDINFNTNKKGIKANTKTLISDNSYKLGKLNATFEIYVNELYQLERGNQVINETFPAEWTGKIALPYPSDYGYAVDLNECNKTLHEYNDSTCTDNNWMKYMFGSDYHSLLLNPYSAAEMDIAVVDSTAVAKTGQAANSHVRTNFNIFPVLYLNSNILIHSGNGSSSNPYRISIEE